MTTEKEMAELSRWYWGLLVARVGMYIIGGIGAFLVLKESNVVMLIGIALLMLSLDLGKEMLEMFNKVRKWRNEAKKYDV